MNRNLTQEDRNRVRRMLAESVPKSEIARRSHLGRHSVDKIAREVQEEKKGPAK